MPKHIKLLFSVVAICIVLCIVWIVSTSELAPAMLDDMAPDHVELSATSTEAPAAIPANLGESDSQEGPAERKPIARKNPASRLKMAASTEDQLTIKSSLMKYLVLPAGVYVEFPRNLNEREVKRLHEMLGDIEFVDSWVSIAQFIAINGDGDEASDRLLDFIEQYETPQRANARLHTKILWGRLNSIKYLGWSKGKRAEEFLLQAYENPKALSVLEEMHEQPPNRNVRRGFADFRIDNLVLSKTIFALIEFDNEKHSPMIEEDYRAAAKNEAGFGFNPQQLSISMPERLPSDYLFASDLHRSYAIELIERDLRHEYGAQEFAMMSWEARSKLIVELDDFISEHPEADAWWGKR